MNGSGRFKYSLSKAMTLTSQLYISMPTCLVGHYKRNKMSLITLVWSALILWPISLCAKPRPTPEPEPEWMTSFMTEADLNRAFMKIAAVIAVPVALQVYSAWKDSKNNIKGRLDKLDNNYVELVRIISRLEGKFDERKR